MAKAPIVAILNIHCPETGNNHTQITIRRDGSRELFGSAAMARNALLQLVSLVIPDEPPPTPTRDVLVRRKR